MPGDTSVVTVNVADDGTGSFSLTYEATGGTITNSGERAVFVADSVEGVAWVTVTLDDGQGSVTSGSATINITETIPLVSLAVELLDSSSSENKCLVVSAVPSERLIFVHTRIVNPLGEVFGLAGNPTNFVAANERNPLQFPGQCFTLYSGTYSFTFTLQRDLAEMSFLLERTYIQQ